MISVRDSIESELTSFIEMELDPATSEYVIPNSLERHTSSFHSNDIVYLTIVETGSNSTVGFIILCIDRVNHSVEFRRIVIAEKGKGFGQKAIQAIEHYCIQQLNGQKIWLDVFDFNKCGQHIYEKLGYQFVRVEPYEGKLLRFYEKVLY